MSGIIKILTIENIKSVSANVSQKANHKPDMHNVADENKVEFLGTECSKSVLFNIQMSAMIPQKVASAMMVITIKVIGL
jgi:hypothetical protein